MYDLRNELGLNASESIQSIEKMISTLEKQLSDKKNLSPYFIKILEADIRRLIFTKNQIKDLEIFEGYVIPKQHF